MPNLQEEDNLTEQMMADAMIILDSVAFLETKIHQSLGDLQEAVNNHCHEDVDRIEGQLRFLIKKVNDENRQMTEFMEQYKEKINEKKTILSGIEQKKQIHNGGISPQQRRQASRAALQRISEKEKQRLAVDN
jgi:ABC-type sugar transport system ATPase subunit